MPTVRALSFHAAYACHHRGACCTAQWPIPVEADRLTVLQAALASGRVRPAYGSAAPLAFPADAPAATPALLATSTAGCVFFDADGRRLCRIHEGLGHEALPLACRQFPRVSVTDPRGVSVTLSHYCPTAASLLEHRGDVAIVDSARAFPAGGEYVGLDATGALPPLLRPEMAMDWDAWWDWERLAVDMLAGPATSPRASLDRLSAIVEDVRRWQPSEGPLIDRVRRAFATGRPLDAPARPLARDALIDEIRRAVPEELRSAAHTLSPALRPSHVVPPHVAARFLAAHAFANWTAHLGLGLRTWLRSLDAALALVEAGYGVRHADLLLRHLADTDELARTWSRAEAA